MSTIIPVSQGSDGGVAAVDEQIAARHERRGVAREVDRGARDLRRQAEPAQQVLGPHHLARLVHDDGAQAPAGPADRKSTRLNSSHVSNSYAVFCLKKKTKEQELH